MNLFDEVTMLSEPGSLGWIKALTPNRFGEPSATVVWTHHECHYESTIPTRKLTLVVETEEV
jgi:hypothetical protein